MVKIPTREEAMDLFLTYNKQESLLKHALAVEAALRHFAVKYDDDPEKWGIIGICHDLDYGTYPVDQHCAMTRKLLEEADWPEDWIRGIMAHAWKVYTDVEPIAPMEKIIYAIDELTGFIVAVTLMRPSKNLNDLEVKSVKKKWKDKTFAAKVRRDITEEGAEMLGISMDELIAETIAGMMPVAEALGLGGTP